MMMRGVRHVRRKKHKARKHPQRKRALRGASPLPRRTHGEGIKSAGGDDGATRLTRCGIARPRAALNRRTEQHSVVADDVCTLEPSTNVVAGAQTLTISRATGELFLARTPKPPPRTRGWTGRRPDRHVPPIRTPVAALCSPAARPSAGTPRIISCIFGLIRLHSGPSAAVATDHGRARASKWP